MTNTINFFEGIKTLQELKKAYHKLVMKYHPDINPGMSDETIKEINNQYDEAFEAIKNGFNTWCEDKGMSYKKTEEMSEDFKEVLSKIIHIPGIEIEICGNWVWISGNTKPVKEEIKNAGFKWAKEKLKWYWHPTGYRRIGGKKWDMEQIRNTYGSEKVKGQELDKIAN